MTIVPTTKTLVIKYSLNTRVISNETVSSLLRLTKNHCLKALILVGMIASHVIERPSLKSSSKLII